MPALSLTICPMLIGRDADRALLAARLDALAKGSSSIVEISGEAGIGKSRLLAELEQMASARGLAWCAGRCHREDTAIPLAPVRDLLSPLTLPGPLPHGAPASSRDALEVLKRQLFERLGEAFERLVAGRAGPAGGSPALVVAFDDLHWSDDVTLEWISYLFRHAARPMLLALTWRPEEQHAGLGELLSGLERTRAVTELQLERLPVDGVEAMITAIQGETPSSSLVDRLFRLTDGNPLFVEELLRVDTGALAGGTGSSEEIGKLTIPRSLRIAVERRIAALEPRAKRILDLAAIAGRRFDGDRLRAIVGCDERELLDAIKALVAAHLVVEESAESFAFRHALTREVVLSGLLARERTDLHARLAEQLESEQEPSAADLSHHHGEARSWAKAAHWARIAARQATHAPRAAIEHYTRAIDALAASGVPPDAQLHRERAQAFDWTGEFTAARRDHEQALSLARRSDDAPGIWRSLVDLGVLSRERDFVRAGTLFREALDLARRIGPPTRVAESLSWLGFWLMMTGDVEQARVHQEEALAMFERQNDRHGTAETLDHLGWTHYVRGDLERSSRSYERAHRLFDELEVPLGRASAMAGHATRGTDYFHLPSAWPPEASSASVVADAEHAVRYSRSIAWRSGEIRALLWFGLALGARGEYARAFGCAERGLRMAIEDRQLRYEATARLLFGALEFDLLRADEAVRHLAEALDLARKMGSPTVVATTTSFLARASMVAGDVDRAEALLAGEVDGPNSMPHRLLACARAEVDLATRREARALVTVERLVAAARAVRPIPVLCLLKATALTQLERWDEAVLVAREGARAAVEQEQRPMVWRLAIREGILAQLQALPHAAVGAYENARRCILDLSQGLPNAAAFVAAATSRIPAVRELPAAEALTPRERQVVALLADGLSNRSIADRLRISERTVEKHVENVLGKLSLGTRVQVALWAAERRDVTR